jgi:hypothetical protein
LDVLFCHITKSPMAKISMTNTTHTFKLSCTTIVFRRNQGLPLQGWPDPHLPP